MTGMSGDELIAEGERLARPCVMLGGSGERENFAGVCRGPGVVPPDWNLGYSHHMHLFSFDCRVLPRGVGPRSGCVSVFFDEKGSDMGEGTLQTDVLHSPSPKLPWNSIYEIYQQLQTCDWVGAAHLFAQVGHSLPPVQVLFMFGSERIGEWLRGIRWQRDWGYCTSFPDPEPVTSYQKRYQAEHPLYTEKEFAVLGGWPYISMTHGHLDPEWPEYVCELQRDAN